MKLSSQRIRAFQKTVLDFYRENERQLPWRKTRDPYKVLVSEIMLQQTAVSRVIPFYERFIRAFPSVRALARAPARAVLRIWSGLGYNRRALFLVRAAEIIVREYESVVPHDARELDALPGIGANTAGAILAYAWNEPVAFVETNIRTVFLHFFFKNKKKVRDEEILGMVKRTLPNKVRPTRSDLESGKRSDLVGSCSVREWYSALMDYGAFLKETVGNQNARSAHYAKQAKFAGSRRELRGAIVRRAAQKGKVRAADFAMFAPRGLPVREIFHALVAEGFLRKQGTSFVIHEYRTYALDEL